jgi:hypothetical protein
VVGPARPSAGQGVWFGRPDEFVGRPHREVRPIPAKRRPVYRRPAPPPKAPLPGTEPPPVVRSNVASIDVTAAQGRAGFATGDRVRIAGTGLYSGEEAVIERLTGGVIPGALVRTEAGRTRQVRTIDLEPVPRGES